MLDRVNVQNNPVNFVDPWGLERSTIDTAIENAARQGNVQELEAIFESTGNNTAQKVLERMNSKAIDLIKGQLRRSKSYASELEGKTYADLVKLSKGKGTLANKASKMLKLIKQSSRLKDKIGSYCP